MPSIAEVPIFVSSPGDCADEKRAVFAAVERFNRSLGRELGLRLDAFDSSRLFPTVGEYAQAGVNRQLEDLEVYLGVWRECRGTPTPAARSGTEEELENALRRFASERRPYVMAYFPRGREQFDEVKALLKDHGRYYHEFADPEELGRLLEVHLAEFFRSEYRRPGHSSTTGPRMARAQVHLTFDVRRVDGTSERRTFSKPTVAVGRNRDINDIVVGDARVHREQGLFAFDGTRLDYLDLAGDSIIEPSVGGSGSRYSMNEEDGVTLPDGTRIVVRAIVD